MCHPNAYVYVPKVFKEVFLYQYPINMNWSLPKMRRQKRQKRQDGGLFFSFFFSKDGPFY